MWREPVDASECGPDLPVEPGLSAIGTDASVGIGLDAVVRSICSWTGVRNTMPAAMLEASGAAVVSIAGPSPSPAGAELLRWLITTKASKGVTKSSAVTSKYDGRGPGPWASRPPASWCWGWFNSLKCEHIERYDGSVAIRIEPLAKIVPRQTLEGRPAAMRQHTVDRQIGVPSRTVDEVQRDDVAVVAAPVVPSKLNSYQ